MRIGSLTNIILLTNEADKQFERLSNLIKELGTGKRVGLYEEAPQDVYDAVNIKFQQTQYEQYESNIKLAQGYLLTIDDLLGKVYDAALKAKTKLIQAANGQADYEAVKEELTEIKNLLLQYANTRVGDHYLFAGTNFNQKPFDITTYDYNGGEDFQIKVAENDFASMFVKGSDAFGSGSTSIFAVLDNAINNITDHQTVENAIGEVENYLKKIDTLRARVGANEQKLEQYAETYSQILDNLKKRYNDTVATDMDKAISDYHLANTAYKTLLTMLAKENTRSSTLLKYF